MKTKNKKRRKKIVFAFIKKGDEQIFIDEHGYRVRSLSVYNGDVCFNDRLQTLYNYARTERIRFADDFDMDYVMDNI